MTLQPGQQRPEPRRRRRQRHAPATGLAARRGRGRARATHSGHAPLLEERPRQLLPATAPSLQPVAPSSPPLLFAASRPSAVPSIIHYLSRPRLLRPSYHHEGSPVEPVLLPLSLSLSLPPHPFSSPLLFFFLRVPASLFPSPGLSGVGTTHTALRLSALRIRFGTTFLLPLAFWIP